MNATEGGRLKTRWLLRRYADQAAFERGEAAPQLDPVTGRTLPAEETIDGNLLLNEGIAVALDAMFGIGTPTLYSNANLRIGVGDSSTAAAASQTALQAATNKFWRPMESGYPQRSSQTVTARAIFGASEANFAWEEFTLVNASDDTGANLNRKVQALGTKASPAVWTFDVTITLS